MSFKSFLSKSFGFEKPQNKINVGDIGVYVNIHSFSSDNEISGEKHQVFCKIKVLNIYNGLVEVEIIEYDFSNSVNSCFNEIIMNGKNKKFIEPKFIKWEIKNK